MRITGCGYVAKGSWIGTFAIGVSMCLIGFAHAESFDRDRVAPLETFSQEPGDLILENLTEPSPSASRDAILVDSLQGIVFISGVDQLVPEGRHGVSGVVLDGALDVVESDFVRRFETALEQPITLSGLDRINADVVRYFREHNRPIVDSFAPENQDITNGVVQIVVVVGRLGSVRVEGANHVSEEVLTSMIRPTKGGVIEQDQLQEDLEWLNNNPFRSVNMLFERGETFAQTDIVLDVDDRFPLRVYGGAEDSGTELTGEDRWMTGLSWGNAFGLDHLLNYQFTSSFDSGALEAHSFSYTAPLPWRHTVRLYLTDVRSDPPESEAGFDLNGESHQASLRYKIPLPRLPVLTHDVTLGYDFKRSNNSLEFGGVGVSEAFTDISQFSLAYAGSISESSSVTGVEAAVYISPGDMTSDNSDSAFVESRAMASADYVFGRLSLTHATQLPKDFSWLLDLHWQFAGENLLGSEQLGLGGYQSVRGYDEYEVVGDQGALIKTELRFPALRSVTLSGTTSLQHELQLLAFVDYGFAENVDLLAGEDKAELMSTGVGLRYSIGSHLNLRADYGWQLKALSADEKKDGRLHVGITFAY